VPALPGSPVANGGSEQMRLDETIAHREIIGVRQAVFGVQEHKVQLVVSGVWILIRCASHARKCSV